MGQAVGSEESKGFEKRVFFAPKKIEEEMGHRYQIALKLYDEERVVMRNQTANLEEALTVAREEVKLKLVFEI
jgi:hypothetical protein